MSEQAVEETQQESPATDDKALGEAGERALSAEREARKASDKRAKDLERELNQFRQASMSESEKAVAEAEARGRTAATTELSRELARSRFDTYASRRNPNLTEKELDELVEFIDMGRFVGEDGKPDIKAIQAGVQRLIPEPSGQPGPLDLGVKQTVTQPPTMNTFIRKAAGRA